MVRPTKPPPVVHIKVRACDDGRNVKTTISRPCAWDLMGALQSYFSYDGEAASEYTIVVGQGEQFVMHDQDKADRAALNAAAKVVDGGSASDHPENVSDGGLAGGKSLN